jgi:transcriptional regulator with XRE-family HTH domain
MSKSTDGHIDQLVKARWRAIGLSQSDLAEVLEATAEQTTMSANGSGGIDADRLMQVADALGISAGLLNRRPLTTGAKRTGSTPDGSEPLQWLLELRLLRVFRELQDDNTKRMLIQLTEQIVKRQAARPGDAG